jgi:hypothetical protein
MTDIIQDSELETIRNGEVTDRRAIDEAHEQLAQAAAATQTIEEMVEEAPSRSDLRDYAIQGTQEQLSFDLGSEYALRDSSLLIGKLPPITVEGQYQEGDRLKVLVEVEISYLAFPPIKHKGFRVGTERRHHGEAVGITPV